MKWKWKVEKEKWKEMEEMRENGERQKGIACEKAVMIRKVIDY